jgi:hypothetical protein
MALAPAQSPSVPPLCFFFRPHQSTLTTFRSRGGSNRVAKGEAPPSPRVSVSLGLVAADEQDSTLTLDDASHPAPRRAEASWLSVHRNASAPETTSPRQVAHLITFTLVVVQVDPWTCKTQLYLASPVSGGAVGDRPILGCQCVRTWAPGFEGRRRRWRRYFTPPPQPRSETTLAMPRTAPSKTGEARGQEPRPSTTLSSMS